MGCGRGGGELSLLRIAGVEFRQSGSCVRLTQIEFWIAENDGGL